MGDLACVKEDFFYSNPGDRAYHAFLFFYWCEPLSTSLVSDTDVFDEESETPRWLPIADLAPTDFQFVVRDVFEMVRKSAGV